MTATTQQTAGSPEDIKAVPLRHPGRWVAVAVIAVLVAMAAHALATNKRFEWSYMVHNMFRGPVLRGALTTIELTVLAMTLGILGGIAVAIMRLSDNVILRVSAWIYTWFFRSIPRLVLLTVFGNLGFLYPEIRLGIPFNGQIEHLLGFNAHGTFLHLNANKLFSGFVAGLLGLFLSEIAYMAEIVRAGMLSIDPGQMEAAQSVGMSPTLATRRVVLPQAMRVIVPPTGNETIAMLKDTALVITVPVSTELFFQLSAIGNRSFQLFPLLVAACLWYLAMTTVLLVGQSYLERRFARGFGPRRGRQQVVTALSTGHGH